MENNLRERLEQIKMQGNTDLPEEGFVIDSNEVDEELEELKLLKDEIENTSELQTDYKEAIKRDMDNMTDKEFAETRVQAFNSIKDDLLNKADSNDAEDEATSETTVTKSKAELYEERNPIIKKQEKKETDNKDDNLLDPGSSLIDSIKSIEEDSVTKSKILHEEQAKYVASINNQITETTEASTDSIDDILSAIEDSNTKKDMDINEEDEDNLTLLLEKLESQKLYSNYAVKEEYVGPADFVVEKNPEYEEVVEDVLVSNGFNIIKKNSKEKNVILDRFVNSGSEVTVPLVNSGIYVTFTGASTSEIISMNQISGHDEAEITLNKLNIMNNHITGSSIGKMRLSQLIKVVSYYDIETLNFAFYAATHPDLSEITRNCGRCGQEYFIRQGTKDLLINPEDYAEEAKEIRENVTTYDILLNKTQLNKVIKKVCANGDLIIYFKHPSIESYISTARNLNPETTRKYPQLVDMAYAIDKLYLRDSGKNYVEFNDPNSIIDIIGKIKNPGTKYELLDILEEIRPCAIPSYGYSETMCPHCGNKDKVEAFSMENLLFTVAQQEDEMETLRWAAKLQERRKSKKK